METHCSCERETQGRGWGVGRDCSTLGRKVGIHTGLNITTERGTGTQEGHNPNIQVQNTYLK